MSGGEATFPPALEHECGQKHYCAALAETPESRETLDVERLHRAANKALMGGQTRAATDAIAAEYAALRSTDTEEER